MVPIANLLSAIHLFNPIFLSKLEACQQCSAEQLYLPRRKDILKGVGNEKGKADGGG